MGVMEVEIPYGIGEAGWEGGGWGGPVEDPSRKKNEFRVLLRASCLPILSVLTVYFFGICQEISRIPPERPSKSSFAPPKLV